MSVKLLRKLNKFREEAFREGMEVFTKTTLNIPWVGTSASYFGFSIQRGRKTIHICKNGIEFFVYYNGTLKDADTTVYSLITGIMETAYLLFMTNNKEVGSALNIIMDKMTERERVELKNLMKGKGWDV